MKEIIYFLPDTDAGVTSIVRNLLKYRPESNLHYKVIFTRQLEREAVYIEDQFNVDEQIVFSYSKYENLYTVSKRLKAHISNSEAILVSNDGLELHMVQLLKLPNPLVYILHGDFKYYYGLVDHNQGVIDQYIAYSQFTEKQLYTKMDANNHDKIKLLYYPVPETKLQQDPNKKTDVLFVGSFNERKGVQFLHQIYKSIQNTISNVNLALVGSGELDAQLRAQFSSEANVVFKGQLKNDDVVQEMHNAKVLLFPSLSEGLPNVVVEAMKAKCVPVCSNIDSGIPDLIDDNITGFRVPVGDIRLFSESAIILLKNEDVREKIALNGFGKACQMFQPYQNAEAYETLIVSTKPQLKVYRTKALGGFLNRPYLPNKVVTFIRKLNISPKL
ncbi:glycosyltransferase family 4 protein [Gelidibacter salicanalis]|uniref:Glycosyltransferase family 4 protein n=1 Tax=Gelidibacter salicanalis TaxID=291193 RepID=A0A934NB23_9FLAO|nr:glycosyltransferase family 4 protein [Gelidibacter salicanalis]MBJ7879165.1 glycosyltransferase family 4 protein [Gelidibacter salicanalis]